MIGFELKTDKKDPAAYSKGDIGQGHDHIEWMRQNHAEYTSLGLLFVGPDGAPSAKATPSHEMGICLTETMATLRDEMLALIEDLRKQTPMERLLAVQTETERDRWGIEALLNRLWDIDMADN